MTRALLLRAAGAALVSLVGAADGASAGARVVTTPRVIVRPTPYLQVNPYVPAARIGTSATFQVNPTSGTVQFGNGAAGQTPPTGTGNITASYRTGGGRAGEPSAVGRTRK
jgi:hypothetical protein